MELTVPIYIFVAVFSIQCIYLFIIALFNFKKTKNDNFKNKIPISLLIYTKNNANEILKNLSEFTTQKYPAFEIVLINNASTDTTFEVLNDLENKHSNLKIVHVENTEAFWANKKYALTLGIKAASNEHLVFSEIDSVPASKYWLQNISNSFKQFSIVIAATIYNNKTNTKNILITYQHIITTIKALAFANKGMACSASEKNIAFTKSDFFKNKGYITHLKNTVPHSDLFLKEVATSKNTVVSTSKESIVYSNIPKNYKEWFSHMFQKKQHEKHYKVLPKIILHSYTISKALFYILGIIISIKNFSLGISLFIAYYILMYISFGKTILKYKAKKILYFLPFFDIITTGINTCIWAINLFITPKNIEYR